VRAKHIQPFFRCQWSRWLQKPCMGGGFSKAVAKVYGGEGGILLPPFVLSSCDAYTSAIISCL
jgi:hypothetical protein